MENGKNEFSGTRNLALSFAKTVFETGKISTFQGGQKFFRLTKLVLGRQKPPVFKLAKTVCRVDKSCFEISNNNQFWMDKTRFRIREKLVLRCKHPTQSQKRQIKPF